MLPQKHHPHDARWISDQLRRLPHCKQGPICEAYSRAYLAAMQAEPEEHKKENAARFEANSRLRVYVKKVTT